MSDENMFLYKKEINAPIDLIYRAFTSASALREWLCDISTTYPEEGGRIFLGWNHGYFACGAFTKMIPNQKISFSWIGRNEPGWTEVDVIITPLAGDNQHQVTIEHRGIGESENWQQARHEIDKGWSLGLENLKSTLEEGVDRRVTERPLIGIYPDDLNNINKSSRDELGIKVTYGVFVNDVVQGLGAEKAGIRPNDVIVAINGEKVTQTRKLSGLMADFKSGDQLAIELFRGAEKKTVNITTQPQQIENLPKTPEDLAKEFESNSSHALKTIENLLVDVSDVEASYAPAPEEWSVKEVLVHLIHSERDMHNWINDLVSGQERFYDDWPDNKLIRIRATLTAYSTLTDLLAELRRSMKETVALLAFLDPSFTRRKASYWRLCMDVLGSKRHTQEHINQIENNIKDARSKNLG